MIVSDISSHISISDMDICMLPLSSGAVAFRLSALGSLFMSEDYALMGCKALLAGCNM
jgi:hypothetical protein